MLELAAGLPPVWNWYKSTGRNRPFNRCGCLQNYIMCLRFLKGGLLIQYATKYEILILTWNVFMLIYVTVLPTGSMRCLSGNLAKNNTISIFKGKEKIILFISTGKLKCSRGTGTLLSALTKLLCDLLKIQDLSEVDWSCSKSFLCFQKVVDQFDSTNKF